MKDIKPCPFCGLNTDLYVGQPDKYGETYHTFIYCLNCGSQGPWADFTKADPSLSEVAKITNWNIRNP